MATIADASAGDDRGIRPLPILVAICAVFLILRVPVLLRQIPAQDEDYFAVPGWTILQEGIPRVPYLPARNEDSVFYRADTMLFALPPLYFYVQAAFYAVFGPSTGIARLASTAAGLGAVFALFAFARRLTGEARTALWAAGLYAGSRFLYFPCVMSRPDMLCGLFGILCLWCMTRFAELRTWRDLACAGVCGGLGMLTHPFAVVYCLQVGVWSLWLGDTVRKRLSNGLLFTGAALLAFSPWGLLIAQEPELFVTQFSNNVVSQSGPGLLSRLINPIDSIRTQGPIYVEHANWIQATLLGAATLWVIIAGIRSPGWRRRLTLLTVTGIYLHVTFLGIHPTKGYWCYTGALQFVCLSAMLTDGLRALASRPRLIQAAVSLGCALAMVPGSGIRTWVAHLQHWSDVNYDSPRFTQELMACFAKDQRLVVDPGYIFDFERGGYDVVLGLNFGKFFDVGGTEYDYVVAGPSSIRDGVPADLQAVPMGEAGDPDDLFACRAEFYRHPSQPEIECLITSPRGAP